VDGRNPAPVDRWYDLQGFNQGGAGFLHISSFRTYVHLCPEKIFSRGWVTKHQG